MTSHTMSIEEYQRKKFKRSKEKKLFFIDDIGPQMQFDYYKTPYAAYTWGVKLTRSEVERIKNEKFNPNTTNQRGVNTGFVKAWLGHR